MVDVIGKEQHGLYSTCCTGRKLLVVVEGKLSSSRTRGAVMARRKSLARICRVEFLADLLLASSATKALARYVFHLLFKSRSSLTARERLAGAEKKVSRGGKFLGGVRRGSSRARPR